MSKEFINERPMIHSFRELMDEIAYSWEQQFNPPIQRHEEEDGSYSYSINKLYISRDNVQYKTENYRLADGVFDQFERFYRMCVPETV